MNRKQFDGESHLIYRIESNRPGDEEGRGPFGSQCRRGHGVKGSDGGIAEAQDFPLHRAHVANDVSIPPGHSSYLNPGAQLSR